MFKVGIEYNCCPCCEIGDPIGCECDCCAKQIYRDAYLNVEEPECDCGADCIRFHTNYDAIYNTDGSFVIINKINEDEYEDTICASDTDSSCEDIYN